MGAKESRQFPLSYEEALKRVTEVERRRIQDAFRKNSAPNGYISRQYFVKEILGDGVPHSVADKIFALCGGSSGQSNGGNGSASSFSVSTQPRGLSFRDTLTLLVLLTRGTREEKTKFVFGMLTSDGENFIERTFAEKLIREWEMGYSPQELTSLFSEGHRVSFEHFSRWLEQYPDCLGITRWILSPDSSLSLSSKVDTRTFYQTLAGVTHLEEQEIIELEKRFWALSANTNQIDLEVIRPLVSPPLPSILVEPLFAAFDENKDGHIDFKELSCGVSAACRGPDLERQKFCFKVFDIDCDGKLSRSEVSLMIRCMKEVSLSGVEVDEDAEVDALLKVKDVDASSVKKDFLQIEDYLVWTVKSELAKSFAQLLFQLCHIVLGLRPQSRKEEGEIVRGWLEREKKIPMAPGALWYVISMEWWKQWQNHVSSDSGNRGGNSTPDTSQPPSLSGAENENHIRRLESTSSLTCTPVPSPKPSRNPTSQPSRLGIIDNSSLVQSLPYKVPSLTGEGGKLKPASKLQRGRDFELVPERLWKALQLWYGGSLSLPRQVIRNHAGEVELELNPLSIKLLKHQTVPKTNHVPTVVGGYTAAALHATGAAYPVTGNTTTRRSHAYQGSFSRRTTIRQIEEFLSNRLNVNREDMRLWFFRDEASMRLLENDNATLEDCGFKDEDGILVEIRSKDGTWPEEISSLVVGDRRASVISMSPPSVPGMIGLNNLGNTCYMNAALQCVANTKILSKYFNNNCHLYELNRTNPLGMKGHVAKRFGDLVREMWSPNAKAIAPLKLRWTIGRYSSNFAGFQQQDSQELLAFLLDGLHEDLNRVTDKPYSELKDSDGRPDLIVAQEAWENHVLRNKSMIVDLFHGQLKSKVICKVCGHESVRFDPFTYLSLPLPMDTSVRIEIVVIRQDGSTPVKYGLSLDMEARYLDLKSSLSEICDIPAHNLILVDIVHSQFKALGSDDHKVKSLNGCCIYAYQFQPLVHSSQKSSRHVETLPDIQRSTTSRPGSVKSEEHAPIVRQVNGPAPKQSELHPTTEVSSSWPAQICMTGIAFCFKPGAGNNNADSKTFVEDTKLTTVSNDDSAIEAPLDSPSSLKDTPLLSEISRMSLDGSGTYRSRNSHSRQSSVASSHSTESGKFSVAGGTTNSITSSEDLGDCHQGIVVALHRKMMLQEVYFLSTEKYRPTLFGLPLIVPCSDSTTYLDLYKSVWTQVSRLVSPLPPRDSTHNHATDCDDSLGYEYPFVLKVVQRGGNLCAWCPWHRFCRGCPIPCTTKEFEFGASYLAIDWDQTALHLRYLANQEKTFVEDSSVESSLRAYKEPITLVKCLEAFTRIEELGDDEKYYCSACKKHQLASKKLQIWRLPPILIVHLKRFHHVNGRWIKSHKIVDFPLHNFDPTDFLAAVPQKTLLRYKELKDLNIKVKSSSFVNSHGTITETNENDSEKIKSVEENSGDANGVVDINSDEMISISLHSEDTSESDIFDNTTPPETLRVANDDSTRRSRIHVGRNRQESTSLQTHPILDDNLQDFHQHKLLPGKHALDISYDMYAMVCHSGVLGGGHYVSFAKASNGKWFCQNDSSCKEISENELDKSTAYMLFYERDGLSVDSYLPQIDSNRSTPDIKDIDDDLDEFKKQCSIM